MRGKGSPSNKLLDIIGITPAYAGKSQSCHNCAMVHRDHPRLCGEKRHKVYRKRADQGSPPPMRGKGIVNELSRKLDRITPAYAGKSRQ